MKTIAKTEEVEFIGGFHTITAAEEKALSEYLKQKKLAGKKTVSKPRTTGKVKQH
jgi:hypothetical protein